MTKLSKHLFPQGTVLRISHKAFLDLTRKKKEGKDMTNIQKHLELLGKRVEDRVTGFKGVVAGINFDLYGCIQAIVHPGIDKDGKLKEQQWFDAARLKVLSEKPVISQPNFEFGTQAEGKQGAAEKPTQWKA